MSALTAPNARNVLAALISWNEAGDPDDFDGLERIIAAAQQALKPAPKAAPSGPKLQPGEVYYEAQLLAVQACKAEFGPYWALCPGASVWADRKAVRSFNGPLGGLVRMPRDGRIPVARFWPGGVYPAGVVVAEHYNPFERAPAPAAPDEPEQLALA